mgnify:CR=1 FL=1
MSAPYPHKLWLVSREYAGVAEAGGVKNVACSLCEGLAGLGVEVTMMIPRYGCTDFGTVTNYTPDTIPPQHIMVDGRDYVVSFDKASVGRVEVIFILHQTYSEKSGVYTYTMADERRDSSHTRGTGFHDALLLDVLFQKAVLVYGAVSGRLPQVIHCQDAATAMIPALARCTELQEAYRQVRFVVTIHNAGPGYHHEFSSLEQAVSYTGVPASVLEDCMNGGAVEPFLAASLFAALTTVSPWYSQELLDPGNRDTMGLSRLFAQRGIPITGITNGIDCHRYDPSSREASLLPFAFDPSQGRLEGKYKNRHYFVQRYASVSRTDYFDDFVRWGHIEDEMAGRLGDRKVYFCYHGRIASQKGIDILAAAASLLLSRRDDVRFLLVGQGEQELEGRLVRLANEHPGKCVYLQGYDRAVSRLSTAAADFIVLPSKFEPCGLEDFIAQLYGTIPVAHATGGLQKILHGQTGFLYQDNTAESLRRTMEELADMLIGSPEDMERIISHGARYIREHYDWGSVIQDKYLPFYRQT